MNDRAFTRWIMGIVIACGLGIAVGAFFLMRPPRTDPNPVKTRSDKGSSAPRTADGGNRTGRPVTPPSPATPPHAAPPTGAEDVPELATDTPPETVAQAEENHFEPEHAYSEQLTTIAQIQSRLERRDQLMELGRQWVSMGFREALRLTAEVTDFKIRLHLLEGVFAEQAKRDPDGALEAAIAMQPDPSVTRDRSAYRRLDNEFRAAFTSAIEGWTLTDAASALEYVGQLPQAYQANAYSKLFPTWAKQDPAAAFEQVAALPAQYHTSLLNPMYREWASVDPEAAAGHASQYLADGAYMNTSLGTILEQWSSQDLQSAVQWAEEAIPDDTAFVSTLRNLARGLGSHSPDAAARLLATYPETDQTTYGLTYSLARDWSKKEPDKAAEWVVTIANEEKRAEALKLVASTWAGQDIDQARAWATSLSDPAMQAYAMSNVAAQQGRATPDGSTQWIRALPTGPARDRTVAGYMVGALRSGNAPGAANQVQAHLGGASVDMGAVRDTLETASMDQNLRRRLLDMAR